MLDRKLKTRINEHKNDINKNSNLSVISEHRLQSEYDFDWNNTKFWIMRDILEKD